MLYRLMGRTIFADSDRVVSKDVDHRNFHDRREAQRASSVIAEDQKAGTKSSEFSQRQSIEDRAHGMLANPKMNIPATERFGTDLAGAFESESGLGGRRKIRRTTNQPGMVLC